MAAVGNVEHLHAAAVYLGAAVVAVPLFKRLKLGSVLGYLAAGVLIGPHALRVIDDAATALAVSEFGVVLLLFVIGLELKPARLWRLRAEVFGLGLAQVLATMAVVWVGAVWLGLWGFALGGPEAVVAAGGLALSSTAFAVQILREKGELATPYGDRAFAILLFQDIAIVPLIAIVALLAPASPALTENGWIAGAKMVGALAAVVLAGHYGLRPLFRVIAQTKSDEVFTAAALLVVVAAALAMHSVGLSMAMGAFLAGVLLAESEFRHQIETDIEPFRGLLMGLFFISVGMSVDLGVLRDYFGWIALGVVALVAVKAAILYALARSAGSTHPDALRIGALLSQGGEFGFVLFQTATSAGLLAVADHSMLNATVTLSMATTPLLVLLADRAAKRAGAGLDDAAGLMRIEDAPEEARRASILVAGFGRSGQVIARVLRLRGHEVTLIDNNPRRIRMAETFGNRVFFGDARRLDTLATAGAATARAIFLCIDDRDGARTAVERIRERFPALTVFATTYDRFTHIELEKAGAHYVQRETFESALALARTALEVFQDGAIAEDLITEFRRRDAELLRLQAELGALEGLEKQREQFSLDKQR